MRILHTADWHLGQRFVNNDRYEEHKAALDFILKTIENQQIEMLIVAGDIFDTAMPSAQAMTDYFLFLKNLLHTSCRHIVIIGGNHDSPAKLHEAKDLLKIFNIHVVGGVPYDDNGKQIIENELIILKNKKEQPEAIVAAVPYLRDKDLQISTAGQTPEQIGQNIGKQIAEHYQQIASLAAHYQTLDIPIIATGHLFAAGAGVSDAENAIHIGNLGQISAAIFPDIFSYVALGHIHKQQIVGKKEHIRYSGSPIPLSFSEIQDEKVLLMIEFSGNKLLNIKQIQIPTFRKLLRFSGTLTEIKKQIQEYDDSKDLLPTWCEVRVKAENLHVQADYELNSFLKETNKKIELLKITLQKTENQTTTEKQKTNLEELSPQDVFRKLCQESQVNQDLVEQLIPLFDEILEQSLHKKESSDL